MSRNDKSRSSAYLHSDFKRINECKNTLQYFSIGLIDDNLFEWEVVLFGPKDSLHESAIYRAKMSFPSNYPDAPPSFKFTSKMWHPNISADGTVCISILHKAGNDEFGYESIDERWLPVRTPETVILSIISLLHEPNPDSPANIEAANEYRNNIKLYSRKVRKLAEETLDEDN
ncbi:UBC15 [Hepatospora eriocheir]|uniref:UBC15 n=1 Tax=Hepatospora eriocheir TaxID=1081669 RepID=A0A1X0QHG6_9MICR|nr:UBC15 [Hepatospora eriocheir]